MFEQRMIVGVTEEMMNTFHDGHLMMCDDEQTDGVCMWVPEVARSRWSSSSAYEMRRCVFFAACAFWKYRCELHVLGCASSTHGRTRTLWPSLIVDAWVSQKEFFEMKNEALQTCGMEPNSKEQVRETY